MIINEKDYLAHYGTPRRSGRYPWGSGSDSGPDFQLPRNMHFNDHVNNLRKKGLSDPEIARGLGLKSTTQLRAKMSIAKAEKKQADIAMATRLKEKGVSYVEIGRQMGRNESSVRAMLKEGEKEKADILQTTADILKDHVDKKTYVDIGKGVEHHIGVSTSRLNGAVAILQQKGYVVHEVPIPQLTTGHDTKGKILSPPGTTQRDVFLNRDKIQQVTDYSDDGGRTFSRIVPPVSVDPKRIAVRYGDEGGAAADGVIYIRDGVPDLTLGSSRYAQVRVKVGEGHYLKGMAMYKDDLPRGVDLMFNTKGKDTGNKLDAMKEIGEDKADQINPFGAIIRQLPIHDANGKQVGVSAMNIVNEEGDWFKWSNNISSQMLSKQSPQLVKSQLDMTYESRLNSFDEIQSLTNPTVRKDLLMKFAGATDSASVHLKAANLPRQSTSVILPIDTMPPSQIFAPNYDNGTVVVLIRHPHGGTFEIPELVVNNNHPEAKKLLGANARDAVGIHSSVAQRLSGADFDGDHVLVIPNDSKRIKITPALEDLKNFDPQLAYPKYPGMKVMSNKQTEMGKISNLITDMTIHGASNSEIASAVRHSMVVIDAEKHELNYKQSYIDNGIGSLKAKYQPQGGASTIISRAKSDIFIPERNPRSRKQGGPIDAQTGAKVFVPSTKVDKRTGEPRLVRSTKLAEATDAHLLSSGTPIERMYADHSNKLKALANKARLAAINTPPSVYSPSAAKVYSKEVTALDHSLKIAERNAPLERQAQIIAGTIVKAKRTDAPDMDKATLKKVKNLAVAEARNRTGASKTKIVISNEQWNAIQAGAISNSRLEKILLHADPKVVREHATPKTNRLMTSAKTSRAKEMLDLGYTRAEVASHLGVSVTTLDTAVHSEE